MDGNSEQLQVINLKQLPIIEERLRDVKAKIEQRTSAVMALAVTEETRTDVKKIRTEVRKELEGYEAQRMAVKKAIMTPYEQFEAVYKECVSNPYKAADEALGKKIADVEVGIKQQKEDDVRAFFNELTSGFGLDWLKFEQLNLKVTLGESLNLSPSPQLGQYYLVPFKQKAKYDRDGNMIRPETTTATFVLGYKGYIQLALRSGQYKDLDVMVIKQGEYMGKDPETGKAKFQFIEDDDERETLPTIGYMAYFEYLNGFRKVVYWSKEKMMTHADTFSKAFSRQGYEDLMAGRVPEKDMWRYSSFWYKNFDDMAKKTLLRHIISRWGIMSIEMTTALEHDDAVNVADDGQIVTETVEAARASIPADAQEVPSAEPEAPAPTAEAEPEAVDISAL